MKVDLRWQVVLALIAISITGFWLLMPPPESADTPVLTITPLPQPTDVALCTTPLPASGGVLVEGIVGRPTYLNPLLVGQNPVDEALVNLLFDGLTRYNVKGELEGNLAESWTVSEDGLTVTFTLDANKRWHDGQLVTTSDVAFTYGLIQNENFPYLPVFASLWQNVTINVIDSRQIAFTLPTPYAPFLEATTIGILPTHHLLDVTIDTLANHPFNQVPIGTGPFMVGNADWTETGNLYLVPASEQWETAWKIEALALRFFASETDLIAAYEAGEIQAMSDVLPATLPTIASLPNIRLFSSPQPHYAQVLLNVSRGAKLSDRTVRQALNLALDRENVRAAALNGQGISFAGPYLPSSWAYNPQLTPLPTYNVLSATQLLETAGWQLPVDDTGAIAGNIRQQDDTLLTLQLILADDPLQRTMASNLVEQWQAIGVQVDMQALPIADFQARLTDRVFDMALVEINPLGDPDLYNFWSQEAIIRGQNYGAWNHRRASEALETARLLWDEQERRHYYNQFLYYYQQDLPAFTLAQHTTTYALHASVNNADIGPIYQPRDRYKTLANWSVRTEETAVPCSPP